MVRKKRLIDIDALIERFGEEPMVWNDSEAEIQERDDYRKYKEIVETQPTVDAVEVKHGRWVEVSSLAGLPWKVWCDYCGCPQDYKYNYCPNCGAEMDGEDTEMRNDDGRS